MDQIVTRKLTRFPARRKISLLYSKNDVGENECFLALVVAKMSFPSFLKRSGRRILWAFFVTFAIAGNPGSLNANGNVILAYEVLRYAAGMTLIELSSLVV